MRTAIKGRPGRVCIFLLAALDFLLPRKCIVCGRELGLKEKHLCLNCQADLPLTRNWLCRHNPMADQFNGMLERMKPEPYYEPYADAAALLFYRSDSPYCRIPRALKYGGDIAAGRYFAAQLGRRMAEQPHWQDVDVVIPVPLHWSRKHARGYNQAEIIAAELAKALDAKLCTDVLRRARRTRSQTSLSAEERLQNVSGVFSVVKPPREARHIVIVDDTFTTGATLAACYMALRGVIGMSVHISVATLAAVYS